MRTFTGLDMVFKLLKGDVSSAELEALLANPLYLGPWREILKTTELNALFNSPVALSAIFGSNAAFSGLLDIAGAQMAASDGVTELITNNSSSALTVVSNATYLDYWNSVPANKTRLKNRVNAAGSKIKSYNYTTGGSRNLTLPAGYVGLSVTLVGAGGKGSYGDEYFSGGSFFGVQSGPGGGGGEVRTKTFYGDDLPPAGDVSITTNYLSDATFGPYLTALKGGSATGGSGSQSTQVSPVAGAGGGVNDNHTAIYTDLPNEVWQPATARRKGGNGASSAGTSWSGSAPSGNGSVGGPGIDGAGGGTAGVTTGPGGPGTSISAGGGSAGYNGLNSGSSSSSASAIGAGSGGKAGGSGSTGNGGCSAAYIRVIEG